MLGIDQAAMKAACFHYPAEILQPMRKHKPDGGTGVDSTSIEGLWRFSRHGQEQFQEFLFPTKPRGALSSRMFSALVTFAEKTDRWLEERTPAT